MKIKFSIYLSILLILITGCASGPKPQQGWYPKIAQFDKVSPHATLPRTADGILLDAMTSGEVDEAWAKQHHSIWLDEVKAKLDERGLTLRG